jgi:hypothetical protein
MRSVLLTKVCSAAESNSVITPGLLGGGDGLVDANHGHF